MPKDEERSWIKDVFSRIMGREAPATDYLADQPAVQETPGTRVTSAEIEEPGATEAPSSSTMNIASKLKILKQTFDFEPGLKNRLGAIHSCRELLLFIADSFLYRFEKLREIGLLSQESAIIYEALNEKLAMVLMADQHGVGPEGSPSDPQELFRENTELRQEIDSIRARYVKTGIVTDTELAQDKEIQYLQGRVREQQTKLKVMHQRLKTTESFREMAQSLQARLSLLQAKLVHQSRLIRSMTAGNPRHQDLLATVKQLTDENKQLKHELEKQADPMGDLKRRLPSEAHPMIEELVHSNVRLLADIDDKDQQLEIVSGGSQEDLVDYIERLSEKNTHLKEQLSTRQSIDQLLKDLDTQTDGKPGRIIEALSTENLRLKHDIQRKEAQLQAISAEPANHPLRKAYTRLQLEYRELNKEKQLQEAIYRQEQEERQVLLAQARERALLLKENRQLKAQLASNQQLGPLLNKAETQCQVLKKERSELVIKYERALVELEGAKKKLDKITAEYGLLMGEYHKLFDT